MTLPAKKFQNYSLLTDKQLFKKIQNGDELAFEDLVKRYFAKVRGTVSKFLRNFLETETVTWVVFEKIWRKSKSFCGDSELSTWIYSIAKNESLMALRKRKINAWLVAENDDSVLKGKVDTRILSDTYLEIKEEMEIAAKNVVPRLGPALFLTVLGYSNEEVATKLKMSVAAIKSRKHRSRCLLKIKDPTPGLIRKTISGTQ